jgi:hypothetical protein
MDKSLRLKFRLFREKISWGEMPLEKKGKIPFTFVFQKLVFFHLKL